MTAQTVYKTNRPEVAKQRNGPEDFTEVEYYQLALSDEDIDGIGKPTVRVFHGFWDGLDKEPKANSQVLNHAYDTWEEATIHYEKQLAHYAALGYIYSFTPDPFSPTGGYYRKLA